LSEGWENDWKEVCSNLNLEPARIDRNSVEEWRSFIPEFRFKAGDLGRAAALINFWRFRFNAEAQE